jgi:hypothetical protein
VPKYRPPCYAFSFAVVSRASYIVIHCCFARYRSEAADEEEMLEVIHSSGYARGPSICS